VQRLLVGGSWAPSASAVVGSDGSFVAGWRANAVGAQTVRALLAGSQAQAASAVTTAAPAPTTHVTIFRPVVASWYGPGLYGKHTACGQVMSHRLLGVANRSLPCGTPVTLLLGGRSLTVPVVDRGPFAAGISYDVTSAAATELGMRGTTVIGALAQRGATMPSAPAAPPASPTGGTSYSPAG
jgi:peptidoglycan lytic transglycosylase